jgi:hypothetical protein
VIAQKKDSTYSVSGVLERWDIADEDDEMWTTIATDPCGSKWGLKNFSLKPSIFSQIWPSELFP